MIIPLHFEVSGYSGVLLSNSHMNSEESSILIEKFPFGILVKSLEQTL